MLSTEVFAMMPPSGGDGDSGGMGMLVMVAAMFAIMYFLIIRPQQKRQKEHKSMLNELKNGENIITASGLHGRIMTQTDDTMNLEIAPNVTITIEKSAVANKKK